MVNDLLDKGHDVTIATRGRNPDNFGGRVERITFERTDPASVREALAGKHFDVIIDKIAYCSNDIRMLMDAADFDRYIYMSSTAVYDPKHVDTKEDEFDGMKGDLVWCNRQDFPYDVIKRHAEYALWQKYSDRNFTAVRYPFVIGRDDYTKRLLFYVEHAVKKIPMYIDNIDAKMGFIRSDEAGKFMSFLVDNELRGAVNGSSKGTISMHEVLDYVEKKTGCRALLADDGDNAPYNGETEYSINTDKADALDFGFSDLKDWIYDLIDYYIGLVRT